MFGQLAVLRSVRLVAELAPVPHILLKQVYNYLTEICGPMSDKSSVIQTWKQNMLEELTVITGQMVATLESSSKTSSLFRRLKEILSQLCTARSRVIFINNKTPILRWSVKSLLVGCVRLLGELKSSFQKLFEYSVGMVFGIVDIWRSRYLYIQQSMKSDTTIIGDITSRHEMISGFIYNAYLLCILLETIDLQNGVGWACDECEKYQSPVTTTTNSPLRETHKSSDESRIEVLEGTPVRNSGSENRSNESCASFTPSRSFTSIPAGKLTPISDLLKTSEFKKNSNASGEVPNLTREELFDGDALAEHVDIQREKAHRICKKLFDDLEMPVKLKDGEHGDSRRVDFTSLIYDTIVEGCNLLSLMAYLDSQFLGNEIYYIRENTAHALEGLNDVLDGLSHLVTSLPNYLRSLRWSKQMKVMISNPFTYKYKKESNMNRSIWEGVLIQQCKMGASIHPLSCDKAGLYGLSRLARSYFKHRNQGLTLISKLLCYFERPVIEDTLNPDDTITRSSISSDDDVTSYRDNDTNVMVNSNAGIFVPQIMKGEYLEAICYILQQPWYSPYLFTPKITSVLNAEELSWSVCSPSYWSDMDRWKDVKRPEGIDKLLIDYNKRVHGRETDPGADSNDSRVTSNKPQYLSEILIILHLVIQTYRNALKVLTILDRQGLVEAKDVVVSCFVLYSTLAGFMSNQFVEMVMSMKNLPIGLKNQSGDGKSFTNFLKNLITIHSTSDHYKNMMGNFVDRSLIKSFCSSYAIGVFDYHIRMLKGINLDIYEYAIIGIRLGRKTVISDQFPGAAYKEYCASYSSNRQGFFQKYVNKLTSMARMDMYDDLEKLDCDELGDMFKRLLKYATDKIKYHQKSVMREVVENLDFQLIEMDFEQEFFDKVKTFNQSDYEDEMEDDTEFLTEEIPNIIYAPLTFCQWTCENLSSLVFIDKGSVDDIQRIISIELNSLISYISGYASNTLYVNDDVSLVNTEKCYELHKICLKLCIANSVKMALCMLAEEINIKFKNKNSDDGANDQDVNDLNDTSPSESAASPPTARKTKEKDPQIWNIEGQEETTRLLDWDHKVWFTRSALPMIKMFLQSVKYKDMIDNNDALIEMNFNNRILKLIFDNIDYLNNDESEDGEESPQPPQQQIREVINKKDKKRKLKINVNTKVRSKRKISRLEGSSPATDHSSDSDFHM